LTDQTGATRLVAVVSTGGGLTELQVINVEIIAFALSKK
jgi:hypothetical protein